MKISESEKYPYLCENRKQIRSAPGHQGTRTYLTRQREQNPIQKLAPTQPHQMTLCIFSTICIKHCTSPHRSILVSRAAEAEPTGCRAESDLYRGIIIQCGGARVIIQCGSARVIRVIFGSRFSLDAGCLPRLGPVSDKRRLEKTVRPPFWL